MAQEAMGLPKPESQENQETQENQENQEAQTSQSSEHTTQQTQDTPPTSIPKVDERDELIKQQAAMLQSFRAELNRLTQQNTKDHVAPPPPRKTDEERNKQFWENPIQLLREEMADMIAPIKDHIGKSAKKDAYTELKERFKQDPRFKVVLERAENYVDQLMANQTPSEANLQAVLYGIRGAAALGDIPVSFDEVQSNNEPTQKSNKSMLPPHLKPSAPPAQKGEEQKKVRPLTELEKRLARENRMSDEEYLAMMEIRPDQITSVERKAK